MQFVYGAIARRLMHSLGSAFILLASACASSDEPAPLEMSLVGDSGEAVFRFVDVGAGLCVMAEFPGEHHLLYDAGHWHSSQCTAAAREIVDDDRIELIILSHSDSDHLGELNEILADLDADTILHTGFERSTNTYAAAMQAIDNEVTSGAAVISLADTSLAPGHSFALGAAQVVFIAGWHEWDPSLSDTGATPSSSEIRNVVSIVVRIDYGGRSVLLTGDTVGRRLNDAPHACRDAQRVMVERQAQVGLRSDIMLSAHHGGDNGDALCFIEAVNPEAVIISAGHDHEHPRESTVERYLAAGIPAERIYRTDRGDDEGPNEWDGGRIDKCIDGRGEDTIELRLPSDRRRPIEIAYLNPARCERFSND